MICPFSSVLAPSRREWMHIPKLYAKHFSRSIDLSLNDCDFWLFHLMIWNSMEAQHKLTFQKRMNAHFQLLQPFFSTYGLGYNPHMTRPSQSFTSGLRYSKSLSFNRSQLGRRVVIFCFSIECWRFVEARCLMGTVDLPYLFGVLWLCFQIFNPIPHGHL